MAIKLSNQPSEQLAQQCRDFKHEYTTWRDSVIAQKAEQKEQSAEQTPSTPS